MDDIAGKLKEKVFMNIGNTEYEPKNTKFSRFIGLDEFRQYLKKARVVVTHGGIGTIIDCLYLGKPMVIVPRLKEFGEHTNNHQLDLARELEKQGKAISVFDISNLEDSIKKAGKMRFPKKIEDSTIKMIKEFLEELNGELSRDY
jgi:UDP-N-acetylglucosamine transferase subunit ALG13